MSDDFTISLRLCDDAGMVSHERIDAPSEGTLPTKDRSYLDRHNRLARMTHGARGGRVDEITEPFRCTGSAHFMGEHMRCTSPAHNVQLLGAHVSVAASAGGFGTGANPGAFLVPNATASAAPAAPSLQEETDRRAVRLRTRIAQLVAEPLPGPDAHARHWRTADEILKLVARSQHQEETETRELDVALVAKAFASQPYIEPALRDQLARDGEPILRDAIAAAAASLPTGGGERGEDREYALSAIRFGREAITCLRLALKPFVDAKPLPDGDGYRLHVSSESVDYARRVLDLLADESTAAASSSEEGER